MAPHTRTDDLNLLLTKLPKPLQRALENLPREGLVEIVLDLGRPPQVRYADRVVELSGQPIGLEDLASVVHAIGEFGDDNRAGIEGTLHRISAIRNRKGRIIGLTLRVGRAVTGTIDSIRDLVEQGRSMLVLGRPGVGKTTKLREIARVLADDIGKRVMVIDTSNEIAGDGDVPHPAIGAARRMQVPGSARQAAVMIEAVENHMPEAIIIDEIGTEAEAAAARTIAERGVQLVGTAHGNTLENLILNPTLSDLVGGVQTVILGDEEARMRGTQKTVTERKSPPTFDVVVEMVDRNNMIVHRETGRAVDRLLRGADPGGEIRGPGTAPARATAQAQAPAVEAAEPEKPARTEYEGPTRIHGYAVSPELIQRVIRELRLNARTVRDLQDSDMIIALRSRAEDRRLQEIREDTDIPIYTVKRNASSPLRRLMQRLFMVVPGVDQQEVFEAAREAEDAIEKVRSQGGEVALPPRPPSLRRMQHELVVRNHMLAESVGSEPRRHLVIHD
jgi:stage III sporulation protein SpoIIIAA